MKKIEKVQTMFISKKQEMAIITKYPFWMKWLMRFVECYVIPDVKDNKMIYETTFPYLAKIKECEEYNKMYFTPVKFEKRIGDIT